MTFFSGLAIVLKSDDLFSHRPTNYHHHFHPLRISKRFPSELVFL